MAHLIDKTYFINDISLPGSVLEGNYEVITQYIAKYEPEILLRLLGYDLYKALQAEIDAASYTTVWDNFVNGAEYVVEGYTVKWNGLINSELTSFIAYYIYYQYMKNNVTTTTAIGETQSGAENGGKISPADKMTHAWNNYIRLYGSISDDLYSPSAYRYLLENEDDFDLWIFTTDNPTNSFGI